MGIFHQDTKVTGDRGYASEWNKDHIVQGAFDFRHYAALNMIIENRTDWPAGPAEGRVIYRSDQHTFYVWNGTSWIPMGATATIIVAADGSGQFTDIQDGIDALPVGGGVVYIKEGTYSLTQALSLTRSNVAIIGSGKSTRILAAAPGPIGSILLVTNASSIFIKDIFFDGDDLWNNGIYFTNVSEAFITECWIENMLFHGVGSGASTHDLSISNCYIHDNGSNGIYIITASARVSDCSIYSNGINGIELNSADRAIITGNNIYSNTNNGIKVWTFPPDLCDDNIISNNHVYNNGVNDIEVVAADCERNTIIGNNVHGAGGGIVDAGTNTIVANNQA